MRCSLESGACERDGRTFEAVTSSPGHSLVGADDSASEMQAGDLEGYTREDWVADQLVMRRHQRQLEEQRKNRDATRPQVPGWWYHPGGRADAARLASSADRLPSLPPCAAPCAAPFTTAARFATAIRRNGVTLPGHEKIRPPVDLEEEMAKRDAALEERARHAKRQAEAASRARSTQQRIQDAMQQHMLDDLARM